jgi:hypothetical protein
MNLGSQGGGISSSGNSYPSNNQDYGNDRKYGGNSGDFDTSSNYGLHNLKDLPRIASDTEFAATCHGSIAVNSIIDHAINRNSLGHGANALASLKKVNLGYNNLNDEGIMALNKGLYGYTLNLQTFNLSYNNMGAVGLDHLIKGAIGIDHLRSGGNDIHNTMQGIFTLPTTSIVNLNLCNNNIGDVGSEILCHALVNAKLPATKSIDVSGNNITKDGYKSLMTGLESPNVKSMMVTLVQNQINFYDKTNKAFKDTVDFVTKGLKYAIDEHNKDMKGTKWDGTTVRTDSMDKWKNCKEVEQNVQKGVIGGLIKCSATPKTPHAMFACVLKDIGMELLDPDTLWCAVEINEFVKETDIIGDNCNIF